MSNVITSVKPDRTQLKKASADLAKKLVVNVVVGVAISVAVTLISGAIVSAVTPDEKSAE